MTITVVDPAGGSAASWELATAYYFGIGCDAYGTCTAQYVEVAVGWANYYAAVLGDPIRFDPRVAAGLPRTPTVTPTPTPTTTATLPARSDPTPAATASTAEPTGLAAPTEEPTERPTAVATDAVPTEAPTVAVPEAPTET